MRMCCESLKKKHLLLKNETRPKTDGVLVFEMAVCDRPKTDGILVFKMAMCDSCSHNYLS